MDLQRVYCTTFVDWQAVWIVYAASCQEAGLTSVAYTTFCSLWRRLIPYITVMKPMSDLCWVCQQNSYAMVRSANTPEEEKSEVIALNYFINITLHNLKQGTEEGRGPPAAGYQGEELSEATGEGCQRYPGTSLPQQRSGLACYWCLPYSQPQRLHHPFQF